MPNDWRQAYTELIDYISKHSDIQIGESVTSLPDSVRPEFYRLFNATRIAYVEEEFPALLSKSRILSESYVKTEQEIIELLGLESITMEVELLRFLHDPKDYLISRLFDHLFDLLKRRINTDTFEERSTRQIKASFLSLYQSGYKKWVVLSLISLLDPSELFRVSARYLEIYDEIRLQDNPEQEPVLSPTPAKEIIFYDAHPARLIVPDCILYLRRINRYIAVRSEIGKVMATADNASKNREWYSLNSIAALEPSLTLVYVADKPEEISLVADAEKICRPDLIIECREQKDWYEKERLEKVKLHSLKPRLGTYIVSREPVPEQDLEEIGDIHLLTVGFDQPKLEPIISALMQPESKD